MSGLTVTWAEQRAREYQATQINTQQSVTPSACWLDGFKEAREMIAQLMHDIRRPDLAVMVRGVGTKRFNEKGEEV